MSLEFQQARELLDGVMFWGIYTAHYLCGVLFWGGVLTEKSLKLRNMEIISKYKKMAIDEVLLYTINKAGNSSDRHHTFE